MTTEGINFYQSQNDDIKCAIVERFLRTIKNRIFHWLTANNTWRYIDVLEGILEAYNLSYHRSIGTSPALVDVSNEQEVYKKLFPGRKPDLKKIKYKFKVGDEVRISKAAEPFLKAYKTQWTEEVFTVVERLKTMPPRYRIADYLNQLLIGTFYEFELILTTVPGGEERDYMIESILGKRKRNGVNEVFVQYRGYPTSANAWISEAQIHSV